MSVHVMGWVLKQSNARLGDRLVLLVLADHAKEDGTSAWPSVATIAHEALLSTKQVQRCLASLQRDGRIVKTGESRSGTNVYTVAMIETRANGGDNMSPPTSRPQNGDRMSPEPSLEQPSVLLAAAPRKRNPLWDAMSEIFGEPTTRTAQKLRGKMCSELKDAGATPDEIMVRAKRWRHHYNGATMTDTALVKHWDTLARRPLK